MINKFRFWHTQRCRHPVQKPDVGPKVQVNKFLYRCGTCWAASYPLQIPFWEVDPIVKGLQSQYCKCYQECQCRQQIDSCRKTNIRNTRHYLLSQGLICIIYKHPKLVFHFPTIKSYYILCIYPHLNPELYNLL